MKILSIESNFSSKTVGLPQMNFQLQSKKQSLKLLD